MAAVKERALYPNTFADFIPLKPQVLVLANN